MSGGGERVATLNGRQRVAANLVRQACADSGIVDWLFFIDGDEVALPDRSVLASVPASTSVVRLRPLESVAGGDGLFKRLLSGPELRNLKRRGLVEKANNARYFHGHVSGKVGVRSSAPVYLGVHGAEDSDGHKVEAFEDPRLRHLHHESPTFADFVQKWTALAASGPPPGMRDRRAAVLAAFVALIDEPDPQRRLRVARELYAEHVAEDPVALEAAGVLERIDVSALPVTSIALDREKRAALDGAVARHVERPKSLYLPRRHVARPPERADAD